MPQFSDDLFLGAAPTNMGTSTNHLSQAVLTASIATTGVMTVTAWSGSLISIGMVLVGANVSAGTVVTGFGTGTGGLGTYTVSPAQTSASATVTAYGTSDLSDPALMPTGVGPLGRIYVWDVVPVAAVANNVATAQIGGVGTALTLTAGKGVQLKVGTGPYGSTVYQLDTPRALVVTTASGSPTTSNITITGYDVYGQPMSEVIASSGTASTAVNGLKAFFQITGITSSASTTVTITVGTTNILGIPVRVTAAPFLATVKQGTTLAQDAGTFVAADATNPATTTSGDVRGTYTPSAANNGVLRLVAGILVPGIASGPNATRLGALGVNQNLVS